MIDAVLDYHLSPMGCGVSKFNRGLADRLGVPMLPLLNMAPLQHPLLSLKFAEIPESILRIVTTRMYPRFDLFLHDVPDLAAHPLIAHAERVYAGNAAIARMVTVLRDDVIAAFCPATLDGQADRGRYRVLVFGMAHKLALPHFERLKQHLDIEHPDYTVELSTAVHEGSPWDAMLTESVTAMRAIFGDRLRVLGYLGDDALAKELRDVDAVAAYYVPALRANNTTYWAAVAAGKTVYTNRDEWSPPPDLAQHSWERLTDLLKGVA